MMILRNCRRRCVWCSIALVALVAMGDSKPKADEYPVLAEWTQGPKVEANAWCDVSNLLNRLLLIAESETGNENGYWIGIYPRILNREQEAQLRKDEPRGVLVSRVLPDRPAVHAELMEGDVILGVAGQPVNFVDESSEIVHGNEGKTIPMEVRRDGQLMQLEVTPERNVPRPDMLYFVGNPGEPERGNEGGGIKFHISEEGEGEAGYWIGIFPQDIDQELAKKLNVESGSGVLVSRVMPESPAAKAKLAEGDILLAAGDKKLSSTEQLADIVRGSEGKTIKLKVRRGDKVVDVEVTPAKAGNGPKVLFFGGEGKEGKAGAGEGAEAREKLEEALRQLRELEQRTKNAREPQERREAQEKGERPRVIVKQRNPAPGQQAGEGIKVLILEEGDDDDDEEHERGFWIGIIPQNIDQELAKKLNVEPGSGVLIAKVMPESPAAKAKLAEGDIVVGAGGRKLNDFKPLAQMVQGGKPIALKVRRGEKEFDVEVTPAKAGGRPKMLFLEGEGKEGAREGGEAREKLEHQLRELRERQLQQHEAQERKEAEARRAGGAAGGVIYRPQPGMPGAPMPGAGLPDLPDDMQVTIQKRGHKPARVTVQVGDKKWQTNENELGMLPPPAMEYVSRLLGRPRTLPGVGGFGVIHGANGEGPQRFEIRVGEDGKAQVIRPQGGANPWIKQTPEGIRIEIKEGGEREAQAQQPGGVKWQELRRPGTAVQAAHERSEHEVHELQEQVQRLHREVEELVRQRKELQEQRERGKKERK